MCIYRVDITLYTTWKMVNDRLPEPIGKQFNGAVRVEDGLRCEKVANRL